MSINLDKFSKSSLPTFFEAKNRRQKVCSSGMNPDYWYAVEYDHAIKRGQVVEVQFWKTSIALYRGQDGKLRALENRCPHRQLKLSLGEVNGCHLACCYHGWQYNEEGQLVEIPHEISNHRMPSCKIKTYPVKVRYGLIWIFPGNSALAEMRQIPNIPELEGKNSWACVPLDFTWQAHHSMIIDNVNNFTHAYLHRKYRPFVDAKLTRCDIVSDRVFVSYDTRVGTGLIYGLFVDRQRVNTNSIELCYEYPHQWSNTGGKIKHWCFILPINERTTRVFFLFYFDALKIPFTKVRIPQWIMTFVLRIANLLLIKPLLSQDGVAVEAEQKGYETHFDKPMIELNPAVNMLQHLTISKWEEHLVKTQAKNV